MRKGAKIQIVSLLLLVFTVLLAYGIYAQMQGERPCVAVLMYHSVNSRGPQDVSEKGLVITPEGLKSQLAYLKNKGYRYITVDEMEGLLLGQEEYRGTSILVTFDDGYEDNYILAYPILKELGINALINLVVKYPEQPDTEVSLKHLTWKQIEEMTGSGLVEIGNHSYDSHIYGKAASGDMVPVLAARMAVDGKEETDQEFEKRVEGDFSRAESLIKQHTGTAPQVISYPFGWASDKSKAVARRMGYGIQMGIKQGVNTTEGDLENIKRITVRNDYTPAQLEGLITYYKGRHSIWPF